MMAPDGPWENLRPPARFPNLFSPFQLGPVRLENRLVMCPMTTRFASEWGAVSPEMLDYYWQRARGGVAMIIVEATYVGAERPPGNLSAESDRFIPRLNMLAEAIQEENARAVLQLNHAGMLTGTDVNALGKKEIGGLIDSFASAAARAKTAGFDGVEIHGGDVYLIYQFLSPLTNHRKDEYGLGFEDRMRFPLAVMEECRCRLGGDFPISFRMNATEFAEGGWDLDQAKALAAELEARGVTLLNVTAAGVRAKYWHVQPMAIARGALVPLAAEIRHDARVPVMAVGRINNPELAEEIISNESADLVGIGRALLADPLFPEKARAGDTHLIRKCIACNTCRGRIAVKKHPVRCAVNPVTGRERVFNFAGAPESKRVWVVGGGPAGVNAARVLDARGHKVSLFESSGRLGGQLRLASVPPFKEELRNLMDSYAEAVRHSGIEVFLNTTVTRADVESGRPDEVVVATGARPLEFKNVLEGVVQKTYWQILEEGPGEEEHYLILGGGLIGCETAEYLADSGKAVTIVEILPEIGAVGEAHTRALLIERLHEKKVRYLVESQMKCMERDGVLVCNNRTGTETCIYAEVVVLASGRRPDSALYEEIRSLPCGVHVIGDARAPGGIPQATLEAFRIGCEL
jgi:2,4-dienoyl-CoA reductase-like NADH-dependent reductase (Old Yellow Enzyme family)/thioredoxin reductase